MLLRLYLSLLPPRRDLKQRFFIRTTKRRSRMPATQTARKCICLGGSPPARLVGSPVPAMSRNEIPSAKAHRAHQALNRNVPCCCFRCLRSTARSARSATAEPRQAEHPDRERAHAGWFAIRPAGGGKPLQLLRRARGDRNVSHGNRRIRSPSAGKLHAGSARGGLSETDRTCADHNGRRAPASASHVGGRIIKLQCSAARPADSRPLCRKGNDQGAGSHSRQQTGRCEKASGESFSRRSLESGRELFVGNVLRPNERFGQSQGVLGEGNTDLSAPCFFPGGARATSSAKLEWPGSG